MFCVAVGLTYPIAVAGTALSLVVTSWLYAMRDRTPAHLIKEKQEKHIKWNAKGAKLKAKYRV